MLHKGVVYRLSLTHILKKTDSRDALGQEDQLLVLVFWVVRWWQHALAVHLLRQLNIFSSFSLRCMCYCLVASKLLYGLR